MTVESENHSLIDQPLAALPGELQDDVLRHWDRYLEISQGQPGIETGLLPELCRVWAVSEFVATLCARQPQIFAQLMQSGDLHRVYGADEMAGHVKAALHDTADPQDLSRRLRRQRQREMLRIAWRDIAGHADLNATMADVTALADACIQEALHYLQDHLRAELGEPCSASGKAQEMLVLGMGKLGAGELNFSSDVDLIFAYPEPGETSKGLSNEQFFTRLGKLLIRSLDENTEDGFVFRVDMRLRPFGQSGALVHSFDTFENYYQVHGREWERYALIKARIVAGDPQAGEELFEVLRPFVFRRYLDFGAFEALREMKKMVEAEVKRKGMENNVKLGAGGIREVEFIGQAFQLVRGGREPQLQRREIQQVLRYLAEESYLPVYASQQLLTAYEFLRNTEHRIQEYQDKQTHLLPNDERGQRRLAFAMGFASWSEFLLVLREHMSDVHSHFEQVFTAPQTTHAEGDTTGLSAVWLGNLESDEAQAILSVAGYQEVESTWNRLHSLHHSRNYRSLSNTGRQRLDRLMPLLLGAAVEITSDTVTPDVVLQRLLVLVESIARRSAYLSLLVEYPTALSQLVRLVAASPWIARQLARHPLLLDELLHAQTLYLPPGREQLEEDVHFRLASLPEDDLEQAMDALRQFKQASVLRVAAADVMAAVPLMQVSDRLTEIAEVVVNEVLELAWRDMVARYGRPSCAGDEGDKGFAVVAYGKLGGIELGYGSDLDLVFLHGSDNANAMTNGVKPIADSVFFARLGQRIIHVLTAHTPAGVLYEVDMRLRPSGASGLLVVGLSAFRDYQQKQAWTWEHQALLRARAIAGDHCLREGFEEERRAVLARERDPQLLRREIMEMRERMRESLDKAASNEFDLKQGLGGIADIEFMVQYGALLWANKTPSLVRYTDVIRILEGFAKHGLMPEENASLLSDAYRAYRAEVHRLTLQEQPAKVPAGFFAEEQKAVNRIWRQLFDQ